MFRWNFLLLAGLACATPLLRAEPLSKKTDIDFFRDVPSRNLKGLATRSDGRLVAGPALIEFPVASPADLLWCLEPTPDANKWLLGTGPDGKIVEVTLDVAKATFTSRDVAKLDDPQVLTMKRLNDGTILAGTSPKGALYLIRDGKPFTRVALPVDSIFDLLLLDDNTALAATGNPGRIYRIDLRKFSMVGLVADRITDTKILGDRGITVFGEIRDRNVRRIVALSDGRIAAGSAPRGNVYTFSRDGGAPVILQENRDAEITDLLPQPNGDLFATLVYSSTTNESRITPGPKSGAKDDNTPPPAQIERFGGRSSLVWYPAKGFPEVLTSRSNTAFYRVVRRGDLLLISGGEQGELVGYDLKARLSLTFAGSISAQLNGLVPLPANGGNNSAPNQFLLLRNNTPGLALLDFAAGGSREAETRRIDLATPAQLGALRFNRLRNVPESAITTEMRTSNGSDEVEGWGPWTTLQGSADGGWRGDALRGRYVKLRVKVDDTAISPPAPATTEPRPAAGGTGATKSTSTPGAKPPAPNSNGEQATTSTGVATAGNFEIDRATLFGLPQNRRPQLQEFRVLTPSFGLIAAQEPNPPAVVPLSQVVAAPKEENPRRSNFMSSQVVPSPGTQVVIWSVADPDGDALLATFSIRRDGETNWTDIVASSRENYAQFDTKHLPDGVYFTRLVVTETSPRLPNERLSQTFETDDLIVDHTPPEIVSATAQRSANALVVTVSGRDKLSLLDGIEVVFNNGVRETVEQPADGVRDGREETFTLEMPLARVSNATSVEVTLYDAAGNGTARRLSW